MILTVNVTTLEAACPWLIDGGERLLGGVVGRVARSCVVVLQIYLRLVVVVLVLGALKALL